MKVKIDKGVPIPELYENCRKYPWAKMEVGDSFLMEGIILRNSASGQAATQSRKDGRRYVTRKEGKYFRCWRIA
jgi:hypothetical protein